MMIIMKKAKRPNFSDVEEAEHIYDYRCSTCHQEVRQPYLKGLWYHVYNFRDDPYGCQKLVPRKYKPFDKWDCDHDFRFSKNMTQALKCIECEYPLRFDMIDTEVYCCDRFYCNTCKREFKLMSAHIKKHKRKPFEFKVLRNE